MLVVDPHRGDSGVKELEAEVAGLKLTITKTRSQTLIRGSGSGLQQFKFRRQRVSSGRTLVACAPLGPWVTSNSTV
jgi:hypothetical protein